MAQPPHRRLVHLRLCGSLSLTESRCKFQHPASRWLRRHRRLSVPLRQCNLLLLGRHRCLEFRSCCHACRPDDFCPLLLSACNLRVKATRFLMQQQVLYRAPVHRTHWRQRIAGLRLRRQHSRQGCRYSARPCTAYTDSLAKRHLWRSIPCQRVSEGLLLYRTLKLAATLNCQTMPKQSEYTGDVAKSTSSTSPWALSTTPRPFGTYRTSWSSEICRDRFWSGIVRDRRSGA
mmetsp:Transcript_11692/g.20703  ORF Transcript_11692/g.20703 Transcript_11692/m.20703 type:complete len:232 (+) Transcript_11692:343-1038(+)